MLIAMEGAREVSQASRRRRLIKPLIFVIAVLAVFALVVHNLKSPAVGTINQTPPQHAEAADPYANPGKFNGKYISYTYPAHYKKIPSTLTGSFLQVDDYYATDQSQKQISIGVQKEDLQSDTGYVLRKQHPDTYTQDPMTRNGNIVFSSSSDNSSEKVAFVSHNGYVATVSVTAPGGWDLNEDLQTVVSSLKWISY